ncbi:CAP domain-containing protein [Corynebacterium breve]|uniref:CAP domain-containing protein n=1 Tax=Corynebacterium breve TaxID=3049799 RepID=A0ABY8VCG3_9CORY|nr:CAP domain-containing protein [Corynebacterium breve]WIM67359.1 CAP domain-containing protein [Corynebacterium breve]
MNILQPIIALILSLVPGAGAPDAAVPAPAPVVSQGSVTQSDLIAETNRARVAEGLAPLKPMNEINNIAQNWANNMAKRDVLVHSSDYHAQYPQGWTKAAENILTTGAHADADYMIDMWLNSPGHRQNMMNPAITHVGVGIATTNDGQQYAVQNFARY